MAEEDPDRRHFARLLKAFREARGLSRAELGALAGYSESTIKSFETGQRAVYEYHARHFDEAFGLDDVFAHEASRFGKAATRRPTVRSSTSWPRRTTCTGSSTRWSLACFRRSGTRGRFSRVHPGATDELVDERVAARLAGQALLDRPSELPRVWALIDEAALRRRVGDASVMHEQLDAAWPRCRSCRHVSIQVLPGWRGTPGCWARSRSPSGAGIRVSCIWRTRRPASVTDEPAIVEQAMLVFRSLQTRALPVDASRDLIARVDDEQWKVPARTGARVLTAVPTEGNA